MRKYLPLTIILVLFLCIGCTIKDNNPFSNQNNLSNIDKELITINDDFKNENDNNNDNEITTWEDKSFETIIRYYLGNFDKNIYFKDLNNITELEINSNSNVITNIEECYITEEYYNKIDPITSMKDIDNFNNLKKITLNSTKIEAIHIYKNSSNIEHLRLRFNNITDITNITAYKNLTFFDISDNYIADLKPLGSLTKLKILILDNIGPRADNIDGCVESNIDIDDIDNLKNLEHLCIWNSNISNVSKLNNLNNLIHLTLYWCGVNGDELCFSNCNNLETLVLGIHSMSGEPIILDINKLDPLINLKSLYLSNVFINKNESFSRLTNLEEIYFSNVKFENIEILESLSNLESISFNNTNIESLKYLKNNKNLKSISVTYGNLSDISDLQLFTNIENLILPDNNITDISVLTQLNKLKKVVLINNPIADTSVIDELKKREGIIVN